MYFDSRYLYIALAIIVLMNLASGGFDLLSLLISIPGVLIAITFHEYAHAFVADKLGDDTPRNQGRLSLNPFAHLDPFGVIMLIFAHIGWGKPVEINPNNFTRKISARTSEAIVAVAGPLMNFILALIFAIIFYLFIGFAPVFLQYSTTGKVISDIIQSIIVTNVGLGVFNLIPLPPLDGSKILMGFLPYNAKRWFEEHTQLFYIIFLIIWITPISRIIIYPIISIVIRGIEFLAGLLVTGIFLLITLISGGKID